MRQNLEFRGSSTVLFGDILVVTLLSILTLGLYAPWGYARLRRAILSRTYYHDKPLQFDGTGGQLFGICLKILLFSVITLGIYDLLCFPIVTILKWDAEHTILPNGARLEYKGTALDYFGQVLVVSFLSGLTLGIYAFWGYVRIRKHVLANVTVQGQPLQFTGTGGQFFGVALGNILLSVITLGIYAVLGCASVRMLRWDCSNTVLPLTPDSFGQIAEPRDDRPIQVNVTVNR